jgi:two-component system, NarL family, nitrate/nitrite response regulator NarL
MKTPIRLLLIDDHSLFRESLVRLLEAEQDITVAAHCASVTSAREILAKTPVDVVLLDYDLGDETGTELLRGRDLRKSNLKILMVTAGMRDEVMLSVLNAGVAGVIFKHNGPGHLIEAIRKVASGDMWLDAGVMRSLISGSREKRATSGSAKSLSARQREVLLRILDGFTNKDIASQLTISETSVKATIQELFKKAGVKTRSQLVRTAIEKYSSEWLSREG